MPTLLGEVCNKYVKSCFEHGSENFLLCIRCSQETCIEICQYSIFDSSIGEVQLSCARFHKHTSAPVVESLLEDYEDGHEFVHGIRRLSK